MIFKNSLRTTKWLWILLISLGLLRLMSLGLYPLADTTEARYGNIARLMVETCDWITPQYSDGVPFWGKPPLSTWLAAGTMKLFGINEFAARFPSFLMAVVVVFLVWQIAARQRNQNYAMAAVLILATFPIFFVSSGAIMTDLSLLAGITLCMTAFWQAIIRPGRVGRLWGYGFFIGIAIGLLAKGPIAVVLTILPIGVWVLIQRRQADVWQCLPWLGGSILTICLSVPWYFLAEFKTPGFLNYFLIGEHWNRFVIPDWKGDLYGNAHMRTKGTIWLYGLACSLPWSFILAAWLLKKEFRTRILKYHSSSDGWILYLILWAVAPMVFFTFASNILYTYVLPGMPAFALLIAELVIIGPNSLGNPLAAFAALRRGVSVMLVLFIIGLGWVTMGNGPSTKSQVALIATYRDMRAERNGPLVYMFKLPYSADFYSRGKAYLAKNVNQAEEILNNAGTSYFAVRIKDMKRLPESFTSRNTIVFQSTRYYLLIENKVSAHS